MKICVWLNGSTNKETLEAEMPESCQKKKCKGFFKVEPLCDAFIPMNSAQIEEIFENKKLLLEGKDDN